MRPILPSLERKTMRRGRALGALLFLCATLEATAGLAAPLPEDADAPSKAEPPKTEPPLAEPPSKAEPAPPEPRAEAVAHFEKAKALVAERAWEAAYLEFMESRRLYPTWSATSSAAACLRNLGRSGEALNMLESLLNEYSGSLPNDVKAAAQRAVIDLRRVTGSITIDGAEPAASLSIDGRPRGEYPSPSPLHVGAGSHVVRIYKEGFEAFESSVDVAPGQTAKVVAPLQKLLRSGRLHVIEKTGKKLDVIVDGFEVGETPWEGPIAAGEHTITLRGDEGLGTLPSPFAIQLNQRVELSLAAEDLGASVRINPVPGTASVAIDGLFVGRGVWEGRLRPGEHPIEVVADGYFKEKRKLTLTRGASEVVEVPLRRDPDSPLWRKPGRFTVDAGGAIALSSGVGGEISTACSGDCSRGPVLGGRGIFSAGYELGSGFGFGVLAGYMSYAQDISHRLTSMNVVGAAAPNSGAVDDTIWVRGFLAGAYAAHRFQGPVLLRFRLNAGVALGAVIDTRSGSFHVLDPTVSSNYTIGPVVESPSMTWFYLEPEARAAFPITNHLEVWAGLGALLLVTSTPPAWNKDHPINASDDGYGRFDADILTNAILFSITPGVGARYTF